MSRYHRTHDGQEQKTTTLELFYDLVFVFAITQVSHLLLEHLTWEGAGQAALVLLVVWWSWNYTTWVTNELDPESIAVRMLLIGLMLASFLMAVAIPEAFGERALLFAGAYVAIQVGRHTFLTFLAAGPGTNERERAGRILIWFLAAGVLWIAGGLADGSTRTLLWLIALAIDYAGPLLHVLRARHAPDRAVGVGARDRPLRRALPAVRDHRARRVDRRSPARPRPALDLDAARLAAFAVAFLGTAAMWWLYFNYAARDRRAPARAGREPHAAGARRLHLPARRDGRGRDRRRGRRRARDRPPRRGAARARSSLAVVRRAGDLPARPDALPAADGGHGQPKRLGGAIACVGRGGCSAPSIPALALAALLAGDLVAVIAAEQSRGAGARLAASRSPLEALG